MPLKSIKLAGKFPPDMKDIEERVAQGLDTFEIHLRGSHLDELEESAEILLEAKRKFKIDIISVHTPHEENVEFYFEKTKELAKKVGIPIIVFHSKFVDVFDEEIVEKIMKSEDSSVDIIVENGGIVLVHTLEDIEDVMSRGMLVCFDIAHFWMNCESTGRDFYKDLKKLFSNKNNSDKIKLIHYADSVDSSDNLAVGEGAINHKKALSIISKYYSGTMILEVPPEKQGESKEVVEKILTEMKVKNN